MRAGADSSDVEVPGTEAARRRRFKVVVLVDSLAQGGAERQALELARRLPGEGFDSVLCTLRGDTAYGELVPSGPRRVVIGTRNPFAIARRLRQVLVAERPDIVHSFLDPSNFWNRWVSPGVGRPVVISSVRCRFMRPRFAVVEKLLSARCHAVVVNSVGIARELTRWQRVPEEKIRLIGNFVDFDRFRPLPEEVRQRARERLGLTGLAFFLPGRISIMKHQLGLAFALARLKRRRLLPETAKFLFAGRVSQGWTSRLFAHLIRRDGLEAHVHMLGPVSRIEEIYCAADWVVLPSLWEGLPNAALEAHSCERPLVLSHAANLDGIMAHGETGFECRTGYVEPLVEALHKALTLPADEARAMGQAGRRRILDRFADDQAMRDVLALYDEFLPARGGANPCAG